MEFIKVLALRGPNVWANFPVLEVWYDLQEYKDSPSDALPGFNDRVMAWLPSMIEHRCSIGERGGFFERLRRGTWQGHILEHVTLELQCLAGCDVGFGKARETSTDGVYKVIIEYDYEPLARAALDTAYRLNLAAIHDRPFDVAAEVERLRQIYRRCAPDAKTAAVRRAAKARRIPVFVLEADGIMQLGHGFKQHRMPYVTLDQAPAGASTDPADFAAEAAALLDRLFPGGDNGRIPVVSVTGTNGKTTTTRLIAHIFDRTHAPVGLTCSESVSLGNRLLELGDCSGPKSAKSILFSTQAKAAVLETARGGILREGLGFDRCHVAVVTNIGKGDHLGQNDINSPEQLVKVKRAAVDVVLPEGAAVLNATDPLVAGMAEHCRGGVIFFARDPGHEVIVNHRAGGGKAAVVRENHIVLADGPSEITLVSLDRVPLTHGGRIGFNVENALAAAAAGWACGLPLEHVRAGLETFGASLGQVPGRFNLLDYHGATVVLDYAHNISALESFLEVLPQFPHKTRTVIYAVPGDRSDEVIAYQGELLGNAYDRVVLYEDTELRGRPDGTIFTLMRRGIEKGVRAREVIDIRGNLNAINTMLETVRPGELLVIQPEFPDVVADYFARLTAADAREITMDQVWAAARTADAPVTVSTVTAPIDLAALGEPVLAGATADNLL